MDPAVIQEVRGGAVRPRTTCLHRPQEGQGVSEVVHLAVDLHLASSSFHHQWMKARIRGARFRRILAANNEPNRFHYSRTVSWQMSMPRSTSRSSTIG